MNRKALIWLHGEVIVPPFSQDAAEEAFNFIEDLREGVKILLPHSRPMPSVGRRCHELRIQDKHQIWRILYRTDPDAVIITEVFSKKTSQTPLNVIKNCKKRLQRYDQES